MRQKTIPYPLTRDGTARAGGDYRPRSATLVFEPNVLQRSFELQIVNDSIVEPTETFEVVIPQSGWRRAVGVAEHGDRGDPRQR